MDALEVARRYFDAWKRRDADGIAAGFAADGTFRDPFGQRSASTIAAYAGKLFGRASDLRFELHDCVAAGGAIVGRWTMHGASDRVARGADFLTVADGRITAVERYADRAELTGLDASIEAGTAVRVGSDRGTLPGAFGITWQEAPTELGLKQMEGLTERILPELPGTPGFLGGIAATIGNRKLTVTAWEQPNNTYELIRAGIHRNAAAWFFGPDVCSAGWTSIWSPERLNALWIRCTACRKMGQAKPGGTCGACGATLPEPAYW
jgi:ketosteroid isomerase-like protein